MRSSALLTFAARRLVALVLLLLVASFAVFALSHLAPGSPEQVLLGPNQASPAVVAALRARFHLDQPFFEQYWTWLAAAVRLDLGSSIRLGTPVASVIADRMGVTLSLGGIAFALAIVTGVPLGVLAAVRRQRSVDRAIVALSIVGVSAPAFVTGVILLYLFAGELPWFPAYGPGHGVGDRLWHLALPAVALAFGVTAVILKLTRTAMIAVLDEDYITFARARGVPPARAIVRHGMRNALIPIITACGLVLIVLMTGAVLVEVTFELPGIGSLLVEAVRDKDLPVVQGVALLIAALTVLVNLLVDILYVLVDPRIHFGRAPA